MGQDTRWASQLSRRAVWCVWGALAVAVPLLGALPTHQVVNHGTPEQPPPSPQDAVGPQSQDLHQPATAVISDKAICAAVRDPQSIDSLRDLLDRGGDPDAACEFGRCALELAAIFGHTEHVRLLLEYNADVNRGSGPAIVSAAAFDDEMLRLLIDAGADVNASSVRGYTALTVAASRGAPDTIRLLLDAGADPNPQSEEGQYPLHAAANKGDAASVRLLLDHGASISRRDNQGFTPLALTMRKGREEVRALLETAESAPGARKTPDHLLLWYAALSDNREITIELLERGVDVNARGPSLQTLLHAMARGKRVEFLRLLLDHGADPNLEDVNRVTPLMSAATKGDAQLAVVELLLAAGARADAFTAQGSTAVHIAARTGGVDVLHRLLDSLPPQRRQATLDRFDGVIHGADGLEPELMETPLWAALRSDQAEALAVLLDYGASPSLRRPDGVPPIHPAAERGSVEAMRLLIDAGASPNATSPDGGHALVIAAENPDPDVMTFLLAQGVDPNSRGREGATALHIAAARYRPEYVDRLLDAGADPTLRDAEGRTPLMYVPKRPDDSGIGMARALVEAGASVRARDHDGRPATLFAIQYRDHQVLEFLLNAGADPHADCGDGSPLMSRAAMSSAAVIGALIDAGVDADVVDKEGITPLVNASRAGSPEAVAALVAAGADLERRDERGRTPLMLASMKPYHRGFQGLVDAGIDLDARDDAGWTALMHAVHAQASAQVEALILAGASLEATSADGKTARQMAFEENRTEVLKEMLLTGAAEHERLGILNQALFDAVSFKARPMIAQLLYMGADINAVDANERTAVMQAAQQGAYRVLWMLCDDGADLHLADADGRIVHDFVAAHPSENLRVSMMETLRRFDADRE